MDFQEMILTLEKFWSEQQCILAQPYDLSLIHIWDHWEERDQRPDDC